MGKRKRKEKESHTCKVYWQGTCYAMTFPMQLARALEVQEGDRLVVYLEGGNLVVERFIEGREYPEDAMYTAARIIGAGIWKDDKIYKQLGFTVPKPLAEEIKKDTFKFPVEALA